MDWSKFVNGNREVVSKKANGYNHTIMAIVKEITEANTLSNWVKETNEKISFQHNF